MRTFIGEGTVKMQQFKYCWLGFQTEKATFPAGTFLEEHDSVKGKELTCNE